MKPQAPNIVSSALGLDFFVHRPQARSPKATLKFGDVGATTIQQGIDFIVHLPGERGRKRQRQRKVLDGVGIFKIFEVFPDIYELK